MDPELEDVNEGSLLIDTWDAQQFKVVNEDANSKVDGINVLARVSGPAFFPDTVSGNRVFYKKSVWEEVLNDPAIRSKLNDKLMFGTIGHDIKLTDEEVRNGLASHIVTDMWIDPDTGIGMAEFLVLGTKVGKILNTILRAGSKLRVSTKSRALLTPPDKNGVRSTQSGRYRFDRIDFVLTPGFDEALPEVVESLNEIMKNTNVEESSTMNETIELLQNLLKDTVAEVSESKGKNSQMEAALSDVNTKLTEAVKSLEPYAALGTAQEVSESLAKLQEYSNIGTPQEINEALTAAKERVDYLTGVVQENAREVSESLAQEEEQNTQLSDYAELGTPEEINEALNYVEQFKDLGTPEEINEALDAFAALKETQFQEHVGAMAKSFGVTPTIVNSLYDSMKSFDKVEEALTEQAKVSGKDVNESRSGKPFSTENLMEEIHESKTVETPYSGQSRAAKLMHLKHN